ncbi:MAG: hypothetical protein Q9184_007270 [Pyrenodesmia sp. 2 TL-2023]
MDEDAIRSLGPVELEVLVPQATNLSLNDLGASDEPTPDKDLDENNATHGLKNLSSIPLRTSLQFDEQLDVFVLLRTTSGLAEWKKHLPYLQITVEAQAYGSSQRAPDNLTVESQSVQPQGKDVIWSGTVDTSREAVVIGDERGNALVWVVSCFLSRPRMRMQHLMIWFKASGILRHPPSSSGDSVDPFLPSGVPASINALEPLSGDPGLRGIRPQLTALRLDRININNSSAARETVIRTKPQKPFPALPAISARVRYSKSGAYTGRHCIIASLDIETAPFQEDKIELTDVNMLLSDGTAEDICRSHGINLPITCRPRDNIVFLFRLLPDYDHTSTSKANSNSRTLDVSIDARVLISGECRPNIQMRWKTLVNFSTVLNPKYGTPAQTMQRSRRSSSLSVPTDTENRGPEDGDEYSVSTQRGSSFSTFGLTLTLTAPKDVYVGQPFTWDVFLVNNSSKPRRLAILVIPKRKFVDHKNNISKTSMSSTVTGQGAKPGRIGIADAVMDENRLYTMQQGLAKEEVGIISLSTEVHVGTLNPGFCHNTELKFLPLAKGVLHIEAVRVVDLVENKSVDIHDLPEIVAEERVLAVDEPAKEPSREG